MDSQGFIIEHGHQVRAYELAAVTGTPVDEIEKLRGRGVCRKPAAGAKSTRNFSALFTLFHGRAPRDDEWPAPRLTGHGNYGWQGRDLEFLATLVGQLSLTEIAAVMTGRLQAQTGDPTAQRSKASVQCALTRLGLQVSDVLGGILLRDAAREIGSYAIVYQAIERKALKARKVGRLYVIPHKAWAEWKATRTIAPEGWVRLSSLRAPLGCRSDKLSEYARQGLIPGVIQCNAGCTGNGPSTQWGTWFIDPAQAEKLLADRKAGLPMPWHGKYEGNLRVCFKNWNRRRHPPSCSECEAIWGRAGAPENFEAFRVQYPNLTLPSKRHLTKKWQPGLTLYELERLSGCSVSRVSYAVKNGTLRSHGTKGNVCVREADAKAWIRRGCPSGAGRSNWIALSTAVARYGFFEPDLRRHIRSGALKSRVGSAGSQRGQLLVLDASCSDYRRRNGYTPEEAADRLEIHPSHLASALGSLGWTRGTNVTHAMIAVASKRLKYVSSLFTIDQAALILNRSPAWVQQQIDEGVVQLTRPAGNRAVAGFTAASVTKLEERARRRGRPPVQRKVGTDWLLLTTAAQLAGVCTTTLMRIAKPPHVRTVASERGKLYEREGVMAAARRFWKAARMGRERRPTWLLAEIAAAG